MDPLSVVKYFNIIKQFTSDFGAIQFEVKIRFFGDDTCLTHQALYTFAAYGEPQR